MDELNWNLIFAALLNVIAFAWTSVRQSDEEKNEEPKESKTEAAAARPDPTTGQMMLSKWGHVG